MDIMIIIIFTQKNLSYSQKMCCPPYAGHSGLKYFSFKDNEPMKLIMYHIQLLRIE